MKRIVILLVLFYVGISFGQMNMANVTTYIHQHENKILEISYGQFTANQFGDTTVVAGYDTVSVVVPIPIIEAGVDTVGVYLGYRTKGDSIFVYRNDTTGVGTMRYLLLYRK